MNNESRVEWQWAELDTKTAIWGKRVCLGLKHQPCWRSYLFNPFLLYFRQTWDMRVLSLLIARLTFHKMSFNAWIEVLWRPVCDSVTRFILYQPLTPYLRFSAHAYCERWRWSGPTALSGITKPACYCLYGIMHTGPFDKVCNSNCPGLNAHVDPMTHSSSACVHLRPTRCSFLSDRLTPCCSAL